MSAIMNVRDTLSANKFDSKSGENKNSGAYIRKNRQR